MRNTNETAFSFGMLINAVTDAKLSKPVLVKMTGHEKLAIIVLLPAQDTDERILMSILIQQIGKENFHV